MRQLLIDELSREERDNIESYLKRTTRPGPIDALYWLELPDQLLESVQQSHADCAPFVFAVEVTDQAVAFELLLRSSTNLHCSCIAYATQAQRDFLLRFVDTMLQEERIRA